MTTKFTIPAGRIFAITSDPNGEHSIFSGDLLFTGPSENEITLELEEGQGVVFAPATAR